MTEKSSLSGLTIILLLVGLCVGGAGAYFYVSGPLQTEVSELETDHTQLVAELDTLNTQLTALQEEYAELETEKEALEDEIQDISLDIASTRADISTLEHNIEVNSETTNLYSLMVEPDTGYKVISFFALSFQHPVGMMFEFEQFQENPISEDYGILKGTISKTSRDELIQYVWQKLDFESNAEADVIDLVEQFTTELDEYEDVTYEIGDMVVATVLDHIVYYQPITWTQGASNYTTYYAAWYCNLDSLHYRLYYVTETPSNDDFLHYLDTTLCHR